MIMDGLPHPHITRPHHRIQWTDTQETEPFEEKDEEEEEEEDETQLPLFSDDEEDADEALDLRGLFDDRSARF